MMISHNRRKILQASGALAAATSVPLMARAQAAAPRVVVIGAGFAGATLAKYVRMWNPAIQVTLIEPNPTHVSCILSNLVMTGALGMSTITLRYDNLRNKYGVKLVADRAVAIDSVNRIVTTQTGNRQNRNFSIRHPLLGQLFPFLSREGFRQARDKDCCGIRKRRGRQPQLTRRADRSCPFYKEKAGQLPGLSTVR